MRRSIAIASAMGLLVAGAVALVLWRPWEASAPRLHADPDDAAQVALGAKIYARECASCHGANLEGEANWRRRKPNGRMPAPPHDGSGHTWHHTDVNLFEITKHGVKPPLAPEGYESDMPGFGDKLSDGEIWAVVAYIKSRWPAEIRKRQPGTRKDQE